MAAGYLNHRLYSAAKLVRQGAVFADVGTDHAYLPIFLLENSVITHAFCTDINAGPLSSARKNSEERGYIDKMTFILTDGATALLGKGITDYAICGMGGELIADIIDRAPQMRDRDVSLILQPMSKQSKLREYLSRTGFEITKESYSYDSGKYYVCFLVKYVGTAREIDETEAELGFASSEYINNEARIGYLEDRIRALSRACEGKILGGESEPSERKVLNAALQLVKSLRGE